MPRSEAAALPKRWLRPPHSKTRCAEGLAPDRESGKTLSMARSQQTVLKAAGWRVGDAKDFLKLTPTEAEFVEVKLTRRLRELREEHNRTK